MAWFSKRLEAFDLSGEETPLAGILRALRNGGTQILDLTQSNPTEAGFVYPNDLIREALSSPEILRYSPDPQGRFEARGAVAEYYATRGWPAHPDEFVLTSGTSEAYSFLFKLLCDPGDEVLVPSPGYPLFDCIAALDGVRLVHYPLRHPFITPAAGWPLDFEAAEALISEQTRAIVIIQPNNPTGSVLSPDESRRIVAFAESHGINVIVDEVFCDYMLDGTVFTPVRSVSAPVFTLNGISKILGLPQLKLSWIHVQGDAALTHTAREGLDLIADTYLSVNTPIQVALPRLLPIRHVIQPQIRARLAKNLRVLTEQAENSPCFRFASPQAGWYAVLQLPNEMSDEKTAQRLLRDRHTYVYPGHMFGLCDERYLVLSLLPLNDVFRAGLEHIVDIAEESRRR